MKILVSGASGLVGSRLVPLLTSGGHRVLRLVRQKRQIGPEAVFWEPATGHLDCRDLAGVDAVVHLAGDNIAGGRWTESKKARIRESRVRGTRLLCDTLVQLTSPPKVLVSASAIGIYGDRGSEVLTESSPPGAGFLADVCREWEAATEAAHQRGVRVVCLRFGMILDPEGGALAKMLSAFRLGLGGVIGSGNQFMSWIVLEDALRVIQYCLLESDLAGPVNGVAPEPVTSRQFTRALARVLHRPAWLWVPGFAARLLFGEMAEATLLSSAQVRPAKLLASGYAFRHPRLDEALKEMLR